MGYCGWYYRKRSFTLLDGTVVDADQKNAPVSVDIYYITPNKCTECQGFHEEPQCAAVCPVDCCVPDEMYQETVERTDGQKRENCISELCISHCA